MNGYWLVALILGMLGARLNQAMADSNTEPYDDAAFVPYEWDGKVPESVVSLGDSRFYSDKAFVVDKQHRNLTVWRFTNGGKAERIGIYPIDFGRSLGDKRYLGDHRTPEGIYFFQDKYDERTLDYNLYGSRALTMDYPNFFDRREGKTGSGIWLHAVPDSTSLNRGSRGCVVVRNRVIKELSPLVTLRKTPILVHDQVDLVDEKLALSQRQQFNQWFKNWRQAWENKDLSNYIKFYSPEFKSSGMNKIRWLKYKTALADTYKSIKVLFSQPTVLRYKDEMIVKTLQHYQSDRHTDFGEKVLYLKKDGENWQIIGEEWTPVQDKSLASAMETLSEQSQAIAHSSQESDSAHD